MALAEVAEVFEIETQATAGEFVTVFAATVDDETVDSLIYDLDAEVRDFLKRMQLDEIERARVTRYDIPIYLTPGQVSADRMLESGFTRRCERSSSPGRATVRWRPTSKQRLVSSTIRSRLSRSFASKPGSLPHPFTSQSFTRA